MRSNCLFFAVALFWRRRWKGYLTMRKSHYGYFPHFMYEERSHKVGYVPLDPRIKTCPPPVFSGRVKWGD